MLLTSWIDSMRRTWRQRRHRRDVMRDRRQVAPRASIVELLEERTMLSAMVIETVASGAAVTIDTTDVIGTGTAENPEFSTIIIREVEITPSSGKGIEIDLAGDSNAKLRLDAIVIQSSVVNGTGAVAIDLRLDDVVLLDLVIEDVTVTGQSGSALTIDLHDSDVGNLTLLNSRVAGQLGAGISVSLDGSHVGSFSVLGIESDGVAVVGVSGDLGVIADVAAGSGGGPISIQTLSHGLSDGDIINVSGVVGVASANGRRVVTVVDSNNITLDTSGLNGAIDAVATVMTVDSVSQLRAGTVLPFVVGVGSERMQVIAVDGNQLTMLRGVNGTLAASHSDGDAVFATASSGSYLTGGEWVIRTRIDNVTVKESRLVGDTGSDGFLLSLTDSASEHVFINDNAVLEGVRLVLDNSPLPNLSIYNNLIESHSVGSGVLIDATDSDVNGVIRDNRILSNAHDGIELKLFDSNVGGIIAGNTINGNSGNGIAFGPSSSGGLYTLNYRTTGEFVGLVDGATNADPIRITSYGHGLQTGDLVYIEDVLGNTAANGSFHVAVLSSELKQAVNLTQLTVTVDDVSTFLETEVADGLGNYNFQIRIGDERMTVTGVDHSTNVFTVLRGVSMTEPRDHAIDDPIDHDSTFVLKGTSGLSDSTGVYSGGGRISLSSGAIADNVVDGNTSGAGILADLPIGTRLLADVVRNQILNNSAGGLVVRGMDTNPVDQGASSYNVIVGGTAGNGNVFDGNVGVGVNFTLIDGAAGTFDVQHNTMTRTVDDGLSSTGYVGDGVHVELLGVTVGFEAANSLDRASLQNNNIGTDASSSLLISINGTQTAIPVSDASAFENLALPFNARIGREELQVTAVGSAEVTVVRGVGAFPGEDHAAGDRIFSADGGNDGRGVAFMVVEDSSVQSFYMARNTVVNNQDDGLKYHREDEGRMNTAESQYDQARAVTVIENTFINNGLSAPLEEISPGVFERRGAGIDFHIYNGSIDLQDVELVRNVVEANLGINTSGILLRAEADARLLADIFDNRIRYNAADGIELSTRANDGTDIRQVGGTWIKNTITDNGDHGIEIIGRHGLFDNITEVIPPSPPGDPTPPSQVVVTPLFIGIAGPDPVDGIDRGNLLTGNGLDGITVNRGGSLSFANNTVTGNGTGGVDIDTSGLSPNHTSSIKGNDLSVNSGIGLDINASTGVTVISTVRDNLIRNNDDATPSDAVLTGDGIELTTDELGTIHLLATGNFIEGNDGRGIDVRNVGTLQLKVGDPLLPLDSGRNEIVGNRLEGVYIVNTADSGQPVDVDSSVDLTDQGAVGVIPNVMLNFDTNTVEDNGVGSSLSGTGIVVRAGTSYGDSDYTFRGPSGDVAMEGGLGTSFAAAVAANDGHWTKGNGRINARVTNNIFDGNFGNDFLAEAYVSTVPPPTTGGTWTTDTFVISSYTTDPLSRMNLVFEGNIGNGMNPHAGVTPTYSNDEPDFKRRVVAPTKDPGGPFPSGTTPRIACLIPFRSDPYLSSPPMLPPTGPVIAPQYQFPGMGLEKTFRVQTGFDTAGTGPNDAFETGANFDDPGGPCGWDVFGTNLTEFVSVNTNTIRVDDPTFFVGGGGDGDSALQPGFTFQVDHEEMRVLDITGPFLTVERGFRNTPVQPHLAGTPVGMFTFPDPRTASFPLPDVVDLVPGDRNTDAGVVDIVYSEDMLSIDIDDFALAFNDGTESTAGVITGATHVRADGTKTPVTITSIGAGSHLSDGDEVTISGILGNGAANGVYTVSNVSANTFDLGVNEQQYLELLGNPTDGTFTLTFPVNTNEVQRIDMTAHPMDGHFALEFRSPGGPVSQTTDALDFRADAATIQTALESLVTIRPGDVIVTGGPLAGVNEVQELELLGTTVGGDAFTLTYLHPTTVLRLDVSDAATTTVSVDDTTEFFDEYGNQIGLPHGTPLLVPFPIRIDDEEMIVIEIVDAETMTVIRGSSGTAASAHTAGRTVFEVQETLHIPANAPHATGVHEIQRIAVNGAVAGDTLTISFLHPDTEPGVLSLQVNDLPTSTALIVDDFAAMTNHRKEPLPTGTPLAALDQFNIRVDDEEMRVISVDTAANMLTVVRGINGTTLAVHNATSELFYIETTIDIAHDAPADDSRNDVQVITMSGDPDGGTFTLTFQHPDTVPGILDGAIIATDTTFLVEDYSLMTDGLGVALPSGSPLATPYSIVIQDEVLQVTDVVGNLLTVVRGTNGTAAAAHADDLEVHEVKTTRGIAFDASADASTTERQHIDLQGSPDGGDFTLSYLDPRAVPAVLLGTNEQQELSLVGSPDGGTFTLTFESPTALETTVATAVLAGDPVIVVADVAGFVFPSFIRINDEIMTVTNITVATNTLTVQRGQNATVAANHLVVDRVVVVEETSAMFFDADAAALQSDLETLPSIGIGNVLVTGGPLSTGPLTIEFTGNLEATNIVALHPDGGLLTESGVHFDEDAVITTPVEGQSGVDASGLVIPVRDVTAMLDGLGVAMVIGTPLAAADQFNIRIDNEEMLVTGVDNVADTFTVTRAINGTTAVIHDIDGSVHFIETTAAIAYNASAADVKTALEGLGQIATSDILATGGVLPGTPVEIEFDPSGTLSFYEIVNLTGDASNLTDSVPTAPAEAVVVTELQGGSLSVETALEMLDEILDSTLLAGAIDDIQVTITVVDITVFATQTLPFTIRVDNEDLRVTGKDTFASELTVVRGHNDTTPTVHAIDAQVKNNVSASGGNLPGTDVEVEFLGTLEHTDVDELISDSRLLTENGVHDTGGMPNEELATITTLVEGALSVETTLERLPSIVGPETDIQVTGGPLGTSRIYIEFRGPSTGRREITEIYVDTTGLDAGAATTVDTPTAGMLSVQAALEQLVGIPNGSVLVTEQNPFDGGLPFFPLEIEFTRYLSATDVFELTTRYFSGGFASTAEAFITSLEEGVRHSPIEVEFTGLLANLDVELIASQVDGLNLDDVDMVLEQWSTSGEDVISTPWMGLFPIFPPSQSPFFPLNLTSCYYGFTCPTSLVGINEMQRISLEAIDPDSGSSGFFTLDFNGETTDALADDATAEDVKDALEALTTVGVRNLVVRGGPLDVADILVEFVNGTANGDHGLMIADEGGLTNLTVAITTYLDGEEPGPDVNAIELVKGGWQTVTLDFDATNQQIQTALESMVTVAGYRGLIFDLNNTDPVILTTPAHGLSTGDELLISGVSVEGDRSRIDMRVLPAATVFTVEDGDALPVANSGTGTTFKIRIDDEDMLVTDRVGNTLTVTRAVNGTIVAVHTVGKQVWHIENTVVNDRLTITVIDEDTFSLDGVQGDGEFAGGGQWLKMGNVSVTGGQLPGTGVSIEFTGDLALQDIVELIPDGSGLIGDGDEDAVITTLPQGSGISAGGDYIGGGEWVKNLDLGPAGFDLTVLGVNEIQEISFSPTNLPDGGTFTIQFKGMFTSPIPYDADAAEIFDRLTDEAVISTFGPNNVKTSGGPLPDVPIQVEFVGERKRLNQPAMILEGAMLTGISSPAGAISTLQHGNGTDYSIAFDTNEFQRIALNGATAGEFTLIFEPNPTPGSAEETSLMAFSATATDVQTALEGLASINSGDVIVTGGPLPAIPVDVEFSGSYSKLDILPMVTNDNPAGGVALVGAPSMVSTFVDGRRVTDNDGQYTLSVLTDDVGPATHDLLRNSLTQLVDGAGNTLNIGADDVWRRDGVAPVASFVAISPATRNSAVGVVTMTVSEDVAGVDIDDFRLTRDTGSGAVAVPIDELSVTEISGTEYTLDLNLKTSAAGNYVLSLVDTDPVTPIVDSSGNGITTDSIGWQTNILAPSASLTPITSPRNTNAGTVMISFSESVIGVDIADIAMTRDGSAVSLVGLNVAGAGDTWTLDVSSVTVAEGLYELTLVAADSGIVDGSGNALPNDADMNWLMDTTSPTLDILDVTPDPRTTDGDIVNLIFSEPVDSSSVEIGDLSLTLDELGGAGAVAVDLSSVVVLAEGTGGFVQRYSIDLRTVTDSDGEYVLTFAVPGGVADEAGNLLVVVDPLMPQDPSDSWTKTATDTTAPTADILDIAPDPRTTSVGFATVTFSEDVTGVDMADFSLTRDTVPVDLSSASVVEVTPFRYALDLSSVSGIDGDYQLTLVESGSGIVDGNSNPLAADATDDWVKGNTGPNADIVDITPDPRITTVSDVTILFTDPGTGLDLDVTGVDIDDFEMRRDGLLLDLGDVTLTALSGHEYRLDLTNVTGVNGGYELVLTAAGSGVVDGFGNALVVDASDAWLTDTVIVVNSELDMVDATPLGDGIVDADLAMPGKQITLRAAIQEANQLPGHDTISLPAGNYVLTLAGVGDDDSVSGDLDIRQGLTIFGEGADQTTIDADGLERVLQVFGGVDVEIRDLTITGGAVVGSEDGGGIRSAGNLTLIDVVVTGNSAADSGGGINANGELLLERVTVTSNTAGGDGGGVRNVGGLTIYNSTISGNASAKDGGGLVNISLGSALIVNTTFSGNSASRDGGAIHNEATLSLINTTVTANTVDNLGGGVSSSGVTSIQNTLVAANTAMMDFPDVSGIFNTLGNNLVGNNSGGLASFPASGTPGQPNTNGDYVGSPLNVLDPLLDGNLGDNGGATSTHLLLLNSPAIDGGNNAGLPAEFATEQRGAPRILDGPDLDLVQTIDIGAVEFGNFYVNSTADLTDTTPLGDGLVDGDLLAIGKQITLRAALQEANALRGENTILLDEAIYVLTMTEPDTVDPLADIIDIAPDPRDTPVALVTVSFDEDVINVDMADGAPDFVLTRDIGSGPVVVPLTGIAVTQMDNMTYTLDLSTVTDVNGIYELTLDAASSSIVDLVGNPLTVDAVDSWLTGPDAYAPTADIIDVTPDPRASVAGLVTVDFSEAVTGVDITDFTLEIDFGGGGGNSNVPLTGVALVEVTPSQYTLGLTGIETSLDGSYTLTLVSNLSGIQDLAGNPLVIDAIDQWVKGPDFVAPTADIVDVDPDPRITNVGLVTVDFSESVSGVDLSDFSLSRDSGSGQINIPLTGVTLTQLSAIQYTLNLNTVTGFDGVYVLTLVASGSGILDLPGNTMLVDASDSWQRGEASDGSGDLDITDDTGGLTIIGLGDDGETIIDANGIDRAFQVLTGVSVTFRDLAITGGVVTGSSGGGAVHNSGTLLAQNVTFIGNVSAADGGAVFNTSTGDATIDTSVITLNQAFDGGGLYNNDNALMAVRNSEINQNIAGNDGAGIYNDLDGVVVLTNSDVMSNAAVGQGGGVYNNDAADLTVGNSRFSVNTAEDGAAIFNELASELTITNTTFTANVSSDDGGAIYNDDGTVLSSRTIYSSNTAGDSGGAIYNASNGNVTLSGDTLALNQATTRGGGVNNFGLMTVSGTLLSHNTADDGGAIATARSLDVSESVFSDNEATDDGGAIYNDELGVVTIDRTRFQDNTAVDDGGAVANRDTGDLSLVFSDLAGNKAGSDGGAVHNTSNTGLTLASSLVYNNESDGSGGGLANDSIGSATVINTTFSGNRSATGGAVANQGDLQLTHSTIYQNESVDGGGISNAPTVPDVLAIRNTIVANNTATGSGSDLFGSGYQSDGYNLIGNIGTDASIIASFGSTDQVGTPVSPLDPSLFDLQFNGGPTYSHGLQFGSPARDAGDNANPPSNDQRGFARLFDGDGDGVTTIDIGAVESGFIVNSYLDSIDVNPNDGISADEDGLSSLRAAINEANSRPGRDTIILPRGTFLLSLTGRDEDIGLTGDLDITDDLEILGAGRFETSIDADGIDRVFHVAAGASLSISGLTITGGDAGAAAYGGGVLNRGDLTFNDIILTDNSAVRGGGLFNSGDTTITSSWIDSNMALIQGGGVYNFQASRLDGGIDGSVTTLRVLDADAYPQSGSFSIRLDAEDMNVTSVVGDLFIVTRGTNGTIASSHSDGASIVLSDGGNLAIDASTIANNIAHAQGGGLYNQDTLTMTRTEVVNNESESRGGGLYNATILGTLNGLVSVGATTITLLDASEFPIDTPFDISMGSEILTVTGVSGDDFTVVRGASGTTGALHFDLATVVLRDFASAGIIESTFAMNSASAAGGGLFNEANFSMTNSTVSTNSAGAGGGIVSIGAGSLEAVSVVNNSAVNAGGVAVDGGTLVIKNTLIAANNVDGSDSDVRGRFVSLGFNLIGDAGSSTGLIHNESGDQVGSPTSPFDPVIDLVLRENGGLTRTHRLLPSSPAIDAGDNTGGDDTTDQRGSNRSTNADADIGAYELALLDLSVSDVSTVEGATASHMVDVPVILSETSVETVTVAYTTVDGTAFQGSDYQAQSGVLTFQPGEITKNISVAVNGDLSVEPTESFFVVLSGASGADLIDSQSTVTILNDDTAVAIDDAQIIEGDSGQSMLQYTVRLVQLIDTAVTITVDVETADGTATAGVDYTAIGLTTLTFLDPTDPAQLSQTVTVLVTGDLLAEPDETLFLNVQSTTVNIEDGQGEGIIQNDDAELSVGDLPAIDEGATLLGPHPVDFPVSLTFPSAVSVTVDYLTADGDEVQQLEITGAPVSGTFSLIFDGVPSGDLDFTSTAIDVQAALETIAALAGNVSVTGDLASGPALITFLNTLSGVDVSELVVNDLMTGGSAEVTTSTEPATGGDDYDATTGTLTFNPGETVQMATVTINDDVFLENDETFSLSLDASSVTKDGAADPNAVLTGPGTGTIIDNELPPDEYRLFIDGDGDYRIDWTDPDGTTAIVYENADGTLPIVVTGDRDHLGTLVDTDDLLIIDFINGNPIPSDPGDPSVGLTFIAGNNLSADVVEIRANPLGPAPSFTDVSYVIIGIGDSTVQLDGFLLNLMDVEAVIDIADTTDRSFTIDSTAPGFALDHEMRTRDGSGAGNSLFEGAGSTQFGLFTFRNPDSTSGSLTINAGSGDNTVTLNAMDAALAASVMVYGGDGDDTILATSYLADLHILGGEGNDVLLGGAGSDTVDGGAGDDSPGGGAGSDVLIGGDGTDVVADTADSDFTLTDTQLVITGQGTDSLSGIEEAQLTGGASDNTFDATGFSGSVTLAGEGGNDVFFGSAGDDQFDGGAGNDRVEQATDTGQKLNNVVIEIGTWTYDPLMSPAYSFVATSSDAYTSIEQFVMNGGAGDNVIDAGGYDQGDVTIDGAAGNDRLTGGKLNDSITGGLGNDFLNAKSGNDYLEGGDGDDTLLGGYGEDTNIGGDGADFINANTGDDIIDAGPGDDRVRGAEGNDTIDGGPGNDQLDENLAEGNLILTDTSLTGDLGDNVLSGIETAVFNGKTGPSVDQGDNYFGATEATIPVTMYGGNGRDTMLGGLAADYLNGNSGNDRLDGGPGADLIQGGAGKDFLVGGEGDDTIQGQGANDTLKGENGDDNLDGGIGGYDRVFEWADQSFTIIGGGDVFGTLTGGLGTDVLLNFEEVKLTGGAGPNNLDASGFSGRAVLWGAAGDDTLVGSDYNELLPGEVEPNGRRAGDHLNGGPGDDMIVGNDGWDTLFGGSGNDTMEGNGGADVLYGQRDDDSLKGGIGDDSILGDDGNDILNGGDGNDTLTGGSGADGMSGWTGNDKLNGNSGRDTMIGGTGDDRMFGGNDRDIMLGEDGDDYIKGQTGTDVLSGGPGNDKGVDYARSELGNSAGEIDESFTFYASWIDEV
jgi:Ca2+-binding RTX toxin-like protein